MNIYLHVESSSRELDSKLLLAVITADRGHQVIVSNLGEIINGLKMISALITKKVTPRLVHRGVLQYQQHTNLY